MGILQRKDSFDSPLQISLAQTFYPNGNAGRISCRQR